MDPTGLVNDIISGTLDIDKGRKYLATDGLEHTGRLLYESGISTTHDAFKAAQSSADPQIMILIEQTYLKQELQFCDETDTITLPNGPQT